jgi:hypothetical protein
MDDFRKEYLLSAIDEFRQIKRRSERALDQLKDEDLHWTPNEESNSIAIIMKHISGNIISRWTDFLSTDGEKAFRDRDGEFIDDIYSRAELMKRWEEAWDVLFKTVGGLSEEDILKTVTIRNEPMTVLLAIQRQLVHYSNHLGQILYIGKQIKAADWKTLSIPKGQSKSYRPTAVKKNK